LTTRTSRLVVALLCLSLPAGAAAATGSAERRMQTEHSIARIIASVAFGVVSDVFGKRDSETGVAVRDIFQVVKDIPALSIDGQPRTGFWAWAGAAYRVAGYALDRQHSGSVEYRYQLRVKGYAVSRRTEISDGCVTLTTSTGWTEMVPVGRQTKRIPIHVTIRIDATEADGNTTLVGRAWGVADTSDFRCRIVRSVAESTAAQQLESGLATALATIEREGIRFYRGGADIAPVLDAMRAGIELGRRLRR